MTEFQAPPGTPLTDEQIQDAVTAAVKSRHLSWLGFKKDANDEYTIPVLSPSDFQFARVIAAVVQSPVPAPQTAGYAAGLERAAALCDERAAQHAVMSPAAAECESMAAAIRAVQAPAEGDASQRLHEIGSWDHRGDALEDAVDEHYGAGSWAAILAAVKTGKPQPKGPAQLETVAYVCLSDDGIEANGLPGLSCGKRGEPVVWRADAEAAIRDAQAPAPAPKAAAPFDFDELRSRVIGAIHDHGSKQPEDDETWEEWHVAAFDLLGDAVRRIFEAAQPKAAPVRAPAVAPESIKWTLNGDTTCCYSNWLGETPFGRILITWKGWKEHDDATVDEFPGGFSAYGNPDEVKAACEAEYQRRAGAVCHPPVQGRES
jgi:hypothetical protein